MAGPRCSRTTHEARTISRNRCARLSARCESGLRMRRTATMLSGSACCVYGLTFTSHFYGANAPSATCRSIPKRWSAGKLFEDIRERGVRARRARRLRRGRRDQSLRADRVGRAAGLLPEGHRRRAHHRHRRAGFRCADSRRSQGRPGRRDARIMPAAKPKRARCRRRASRERTCRR